MEVKRSRAYNPTITRPTPRTMDGSGYTRPGPPTAPSAIQIANDPPTDLLVVLSNNVRRGNTGVSV